MMSLRLSRSLLQPNYIQNRFAFTFQHAWISEPVTRNTFQIPIWLESILWAAPKKKTSHSKKRMRASNKGLQQKENVTACPACGNNKLLHHLCGHCYSDIKKKAKLAVDA
ncbi:uncharacterized protein B0P05DRAFT_541365 [Gilbertella persicaria]|uniref:uncharacterized protein n=1 Tax=Gilbertella persicaria TaxID=101096 RepID=UPI00221F9B8D|nr:uncharacterized protein B0P05DRAFT_541365 [Gilbertella persicaria]KAI8079623.1 hypothetical protein B0P05DRAFT_541365 [Gilbertella persicaria]